MRRWLTKMVSPFGGGICRIREVCGAVSGMMFVLGSLEGYTSPEDNEGKAALYYTGQTLVKKFTERNGKGSFICADILDKPRGADTPAAGSFVPRVITTIVPARRSSVRRQRFFRNISDSNSLLISYKYYD